ncbi:hypothetical protein, partial [Aeromonas allosaccharophila]
LDDIERRFLFHFFLMDKSRQTDNVAHRSDAIVSEVDDLVAVVKRPLAIGTLDTLFHHRVSGVFSQLDNLERFSNRVSHFTLSSTVHRPVS